jgi:4'-phosphopantetheinyl transferase
MAIDRFEPRRLPLSAIPSLRAHEAHVWRMRIANLPMMQDDEPGERPERLRRRRMGQRFVLRLLLGAYLGIPGRDVVLQRGAGGKPALVAALSDAGLAFNVSHAGELFAIAVARRVPVGIDIEPRNRAVRAAALARRWLDPAEAARIDALDPQAARAEFLRRWCLREAVIKARGGTIAEHLRAVASSPTEAARLDRLPDGWGRPGDWDVRELLGDSDAFGFVAAPQPLAAVRGFSLQWSDAGR